MNRTTISASKSNVKPVRKGRKIAPLSLFSCILAIKKGRALPLLPMDSIQSAQSYISRINRFREQAGINTRLSMGTTSNGRRVVVCKRAD